MSTGALPPAGSSAEVVRRFELTLSRRIDGLLLGNHLGRVPGLGSEAGESRRYMPGDDPRRIDWNVTARTREPHVRDAVADREVETWLVVDLSASTDFGTARCTKRDLVVTAAGALALLTTRTGDRVGAHVLTSRDVVTLPARSGPMHARAILHRLLVSPRADGRGADLAAALEKLARPGGRRGGAVVVSDFPAADGWALPLRRVAARHETLAIEVLDPRELALPDVGRLVVVDPETGVEREVDTHDAGLRQRYAALARARRGATAAAMRASAIDHAVLRTDRDATADIVGWLAQRPRRVAHLRRQRVAAGRGSGAWA
ncbi:MAG TPA: DUF58 domain-containing protein [Acidimicrobiales bacterium]|nr:DUF58 domain-containing protein [Acidimicrobiales bacterium]